MYNFNVSKLCVFNLRKGGKEMTFGKNIKNFKEKCIEKFGETDGEYVFELLLKRFTYQIGGLKND